MAQIPNKKITRFIAEETARVLSAPKRKEIEQAENELKAILETICKKYIPAIVLEAHKLHPDHFHIRSVELDHVPKTGISSKAFWLKIPNCNHSIFKDNASTEEVSKVNEQRVILDKLQKTFEQNMETLICSIQSFGTFKNLEENFPEAYKAIPKCFFPEEKSTNLPAVNLNPIKNWLNLNA